MRLDLASNCASTIMLLSKGLNSSCSFLIWMTPDSSLDNSNNSPTKPSMRLASSSIRSRKSDVGSCFIKPKAICILASGERISCETWCNSLVCACNKLSKREAIASKSWPKSESSSRLLPMACATLTSNLPLVACLNAARRLLIGFEKYAASMAANIKLTREPPNNGINGNLGGGLGEEMPFFSICSGSWPWWWPNSSLRPLSWTNNK